MTMSITGPSGNVEDMMDEEEKGTVEGIGNDSFSTTSLLQGGKNGDSYKCTAFNGVSGFSDNSTLKGASIT